MISPVLLLLPAIHHGASARRTLSQYDQIDAEQGTPPTLNVDLLVKWINSTNTNTFNFLLWDTDGHQYLDMVRFLEQTKDMEVGGVGGGPIDVWITLVPRTETVPGHLVPQHPQPGVCAACPGTVQYPYGDTTHGVFCCSDAVIGESCSAGAEVCCVFPGSELGCQGVKRCGNNLANETICGVESKCSVPADSPLTGFNESALINPSLGKGGQDMCRNSPLCGTNPSKSYWACLWDTCAEAALPNGLPSEVADFAAALPAEHELHVGLYYSGYGSGPTRATPSPKWAHDAAKSVLEMEAVTGATIYLTKRPSGACPDRTDEGCIVQEIFGAFGPGEQAKVA
eukprot:gene1693-34607_t